MRGPRLRTLAAQITVLAAVPTAAILLAVAALALFLNQHTRLQTLLQTDAALANALAGPAAQTLRDALGTFPEPGVSGLDLFLDSVTIRPGQSDLPAWSLGPELAALARQTALRAGATGFALSNVLDGPPGLGPLVLVAIARPAGPIYVGAIDVGADLGGFAWQTALGRSLPRVADLRLALVDAAGVAAFHDDPRRIGVRYVTEADETGQPLGAGSGAWLRNANDGAQLITAFAPLGATGWSVLTERAWNPWLEAFRGLGLVVLAPLLLAASLPVLLIGLAARRATRPVRQLAVAARRLAAGDFRPLPIEARTGDEVEELATQFTAMAAELRTVYGSLEQRVAERTAELQLVVELARAVSRGLRADQVIAGAEAELVRHPRIAAAHLWLSEAAAARLQVHRRRPEWLPAAEVESAVQAAAGAEELICYPIAPASAAVPLHIREGEAALVVAAREDALGPDVERFVLTVAAQVAIALDNALLYRQGRLSATFEERNRLAREIHDTLAQSLTGVIVQLEALQRDRPSAATPDAHLDRALQLARAGLREARRSVQGLRTSLLDDQTLDQALAGAVARLDAPGTLRARFTSHGDAARVPRAVAAELFRIGEEALTNVVRHAGASHLLVNLDISSATVRLVIEDDGRGIGTDATARQGFGLLGIRERAQRLDGRLSLESEPGEGTRVEVIVPLATPADLTQAQTR